jgi:NAD(P)-dependent dehydrogenase (short-subunit alcohol dehydrogenase family)
LSFEGKVAIVTGSGRETAIGDAITIALADRGASVTVNYITDASRPREANVVEGNRAKVARPRSFKQIYRRPRSGEEAW